MTFDIIEAGIIRLIFGHTLNLVILFYSGCSASNSLRFLVVGDWGGLPFFPYTTPAEVGTAYQMGQHAQKSKPDFILGLGDNFYFHGVQDVNDPRFKESFENIYQDKSLHVPWYLIAGNHDHYGNVSAEIIYSQYSQRWNFPDFYYPLSFKIPGSNASVDILMLDTVQLCGNTEPDYEHSQPKQPDNLQASEQQWKWLEQALQKSNATYLLVAGHFPVYSIAEHGPTQCLVDRLLPMLYQYKVTAYMCGHDHNLQVETKNNRTVNFFLSGAGNFIENNKSHASDVPAGVSKFFWADVISFGGFGYVDISQSNMTYSFIEGNGKLLYNTTVSPRKL
ncbi:hypothetical protein LOTGIDRAFT_118056 [Lottia gigantea]|uniref:Tartrate-resistant acid phosphatase type 5 n=1 Tax=Lottia gigantea TaxID=225164 RepID=V4BZM4_LOTGI|nr:hypothetical protein LOTGIDRAFT_118056 [Lottia gigantea]ESO94599.1 hypothetical protein LOTGIDRAFT_118056 [Lottia gigantea]